MQAAAVTQQRQQTTSLSTKSISSSNILSWRKTPSPVPDPNKAAPSLASQAVANYRKLKATRVVFVEGPLGLKLKETKSCGGAVIVTGFSRDANDNMLQAEKQVTRVHQILSGFILSRRVHCLME